MARSRSICACEKSLNLSLKRLSPMIDANSGLVFSVYSHCSANKSFNCLRRASRLDLSAFCANIGIASITIKSRETSLDMLLPLYGDSLWTNSYRIGYESGKRKVHAPAWLSFLSLRPCFGDTILKSNFPFGDPMQITRRNFFRTTLTASAVAAAGAVASSLPFSTEAFGEPQRSRSIDPNAAPGSGPVFLNSNENAYGPWPSMMDTMREALTHGHRYPDAACDTLSAKIAELNRVKQEHVTLGCGSSEILRVCAEMFCGPNKTLVQASPTFESLGHY